MELVVGMVILGLVIAITAPILMNQYRKWVVQSSAEQVADQMHNLQKASIDYQITYNTQANGITGDATTLVGSGELANIPIPPADVDPYSWDSAATPTIYAATTTGVKDICSKLNELYAGSNTDADPLPAASATHNLQCYGAAAPYNIRMRMY